MFTFRKATLRDIDMILKARIDFLYDCGNITKLSQEEEAGKGNHDYMEQALAKGSFVE